MQVQKSHTKAIVGGAEKTNTGNSAYTQILESISFFGVEVVVGKSVFDKGWSLSLADPLHKRRKVLARLSSSDAQLLADVLTAIAITAPAHHPDREVIDALKWTLRSALVCASADGK